MTLPRQSTDTASSGDSGFSMLEALVSLVLLALIIGGLPQTLRLGQRALDVAGRLDRVSVDASALQFVTQKLSEAMPLREHAPDGLPLLRFKGSARGVTFIAPMMTDGDVSGLYQFELAAVAGDAAETVQLSWQPYRTAVAGVARDPLPARESRIIFRDGAPFRIRYWGHEAQSAVMSWHERWTKAHMPEALELTYATEQRGAPLITRRIPLRLTD